VDTKHTYVNLNESMLVYDLKNEFYHLMNTEEMNKNQIYPFNDEEKVKFEEIYLSNKKINKDYLLKELILKGKEGKRRSINNFMTRVNQFCN